MLQQTQVATVLEKYYTPFLRQFPSLFALANASREEVLKAWEGLGYYRRAGYLHEAAQQLAGDEFPRDVVAMMQLPGVGKNTAHAVAAFAFHQPVPVLEANVKRVVARFFALKNASDKVLWEKAEALLNGDEPFVHNQAMMDVGAMVCAVRAPNCEVCPLAKECMGKEEPEVYPEKKAKKKVPVRQRNIIVYARNDGFFVAPRQTKFLQGLYGFVEQELDEALPDDAQKIGEVSQTYSHFKLEAGVYVSHGLPSSEAGECHGLDALQQLPSSRADQKVIKLLASRNA